jgi:hypothetical protein
MSFEYLGIHRKKTVAIFIKSVVPAQEFSEREQKKLAISYYIIGNFFKVNKRFQKNNFLDLRYLRN